MKAFHDFNITPATFDLDTYIATFSYNFDDEVFFHETVDFGACKMYDTPVDMQHIEQLLFHTSLAVGVSYYKLYPTEHIHVHTGCLNEWQKSFWNTFYIQGLGEFFYVNDIDPSGLATVVCHSEYMHDPIQQQLSEKWLVPIGGGKDSCVTLQGLLDEGKQLTLYTHGKNYPIHQAIQDVSGLGRIVTPRTIDPLLITMSRQGWYNGHVPITGIISFLTILVCYLSDHKHIAFSNEKSANFGNTQRKGLEINHQWSKSFAFEQAFREYVTTHMHRDVVYMSYLRKWFELRIAKECAALKQYLPVFTSCNRNFHLDGARTDRRCNACPKCLFTYAMMRPFLTEEEVYIIWGRELYEQENALDGFQELWGTHGCKPFECVGTYDEMQYATWLFVQQPQNPFPITEWFTTHVSPTRTTQERKNLGEELMSE